MDFAKGLLRAYETKWSFINTFKVQILFAPQIAKAIKWSTEDSRNVNLNIISINTPQFTNQPIEVYVGDRWKVHNGRVELYRFSITFRDQDQMLLYRKFVMAYLYQQVDYFDYVKLQVSLFKDADYFGESDKKMFDFEDVLIDAVSQVQFNNTTESQIAEFTVDFKCTTPVIHTT